MHLQISGDNIVGDLNYKFFEKDKNSGTIKGNMKGDTLIAEYKFMSEGTESVREIAFLKKENDFVEGYGDMEDVNGKMTFKNKKGLKFSNTLILKNVQCKN